MAAKSIDPFCYTLYSLLKEAVPDAHSAGSMSKHLLQAIPAITGQPLPVGPTYYGDCIEHTAAAMTHFQNSRFHQQHQLTILAGTGHPLDPQTNPDSTFALEIRRRNSSKYYFWKAAPEASAALHDMPTLELVLAAPTTPANSAIWSPMDARLVSGHLNLAVQNGLISKNGLCQLKVLPLMAQNEWRIASTNKTYLYTYSPIPQLPQPTPLAAIEIEWRNNNNRVCFRVPAAALALPQWDDQTIFEFVTETNKGTRQFPVHVKQQHPGQGQFAPGPFDIVASSAPNAVLPPTLAPVAFHFPGLPQPFPANCWTNRVSNAPMEVSLLIWSKFGWAGNSPISLQDLQTFFQLWRQYESTKPPVLTF